MIWAIFLETSTLAFLLSPFVRRVPFFGICSLTFAATLAQVTGPAEEKVTELNCLGKTLYLVISRQGVHSGHFYFNYF